MKNRIIENYIWNVTKNLSRKEKISISEKLNSDIEEILKSKNLNENSSDEDIENALKGLGDPTDISLKYKSDGEKALISQPYFSVYMNDLRISLATSFITLIAVGILYCYLYSNIENLLEIVMNTIFNITAAMFSIYAICTIWFSIASNLESAAFSNLLKKDPPEKKNTISKLETVFSLIFSTFLFSVFAFGSKIVGTSSGGFLFKTGYISKNIVPVFAVFVFSALNIIIKDLSRRYSLRVLFFTLINKLTLLGVGFLFFIRDGAVSENVKNFIRKYTPVSEMSISLINNLNLVIFFVIFIFSIVDIIYVALKYHDDHKEKIIINQKTAENRKVHIEKEDPTTKDPALQKTIAIDGAEISKRLDSKAPQETIVLDKNKLNRKLLSEQNQNTGIFKRKDLNELSKKLSQAEDPDLSKTEVQKIQIDSEKIKNNEEKGE